MSAATDLGFATRQIGEIAAALPGATAVFRRRKLDLCRGGAVRLADAVAPEALPAIEAELSSLAPGAPRGIAGLLTPIEWEMGDHMKKEEQGLFPMLRVGHGPAMELMRDEHDDHGARLRGLEALTHGHEPPEGACSFWRALHAGTAQFAQDLTQHIHLESNVLFRRFGA